MRETVSMYVQACYELFNQQTVVYSPWLTNFRTILPFFYNDLEGIKKVDAVFNGCHKVP